MKQINLWWGALALSLTLPAAAEEAIERRTANSGNIVMESIPEVPDAIIEQLNRYQNVRSAAFQDWSLSGDSLYISTRFGDVNQIHRVKMPGGAREQLTFFPEPIGQVVRQPEGELLAFTMDAGGSENAQVFLLDPATGDSRLISDGESRNGVLAWRPDGKAVAYQSTRRNGAGNDIWLTPIGNPEQSRMIFEAPDGSWWGPVDWTRDGKRLLVQQYVSISDSRLHLLDVGTGKLTALSGSGTRPTVNYGVAFDAKNRGVFYLTDDGGEFARLAYRELDGDSDPEIITDEIPWDVENVSLSEDRGRGAFSVNEAGLSQVYLFNPDSFDYRKVGDIPVGLTGGLEFSPDGRQLALTLNTAKTPSDTFVLSLGKDDLKAGKLTRWTTSEVGGLDTDKFVEPELVHYPTFDEEDGKPRQIPAFVYKPEGRGPFPVIISIHGGPEGQYRPAFSSTYQLWMKELGAAVIAPNVRGSAGYGRNYVGLDNGFKREDSVKDIGALLDWIATRPDLDQDRVAVFGGSYGGYMVLASAVHYSDRLKAAVDIVGISNFVTFLKNTKDYRRDLRRAEYGDERDEAMRKHLEAISPNRHVDKITVPMLVVQGQNDPRVPVTEAEQIVKALRDQGRQVWYMNALNEGHGYRKKENRDIYQQVVVVFMKEFLLGEQDPR